MARVQLPPVPRPQVPDGVSPAFASSVAFWARAYPRRWRATRAAELLGLLADLAEPGARRLDARSALDLLRGGWATRLRERPPFGPWLLYRLFGARSLQDHRPWVADDVAGLLFAARQSLPAVWMLVVIDLGRALDGRQRLTEGVLFWVVVAAVLAFDVLVGSTRRYAIERHLVVRPGERVTAGTWVRVKGPRRRVTAGSALPWAAGAAVAGLVAGAAAVAAAPQTIRVTPNGAGAGPGFTWSGGDVPRMSLVGALLVAAVAGALLAGLVSTRLRRAQMVSVQPDRILHRLDAQNGLAVVLGVTALGAVATAEILGVLPLAISVVVGVVAAVLAPPAVIAWSTVRRTAAADDAALVDVLRLGLLGRAARVDVPGSMLAPALPSEVGEVWPWPWSHEGSTPALG